MQTQVKESLQACFRPELLNRLDDIIVFQKLGRPEVQQIADLLIQDVRARLVAQAIDLEVTAAFMERLLTEGYDPSYGARPMRRAIARLLEDHLAEAILAGQIQAGDMAIVDVDEAAQIKVQPKQVSVSVGAPIG